MIERGWVKNYQYNELTNVIMLDFRESIDAFDSPEHIKLIQSVSCFSLLQAAPARRLYLEYGGIYNYNDVKQIEIKRAMEIERNLK